LLGDTPAIIGKAAGLDTRIIGLTSSGPRALAVVVPVNSRIRSPKDLKGKKVAVVKGSYAHHLLALVLKKGGLTTKDIEFINLSQADIATSIVNGNIDAAAVWEPLISKLETQGAVRVIADGTGIKKGRLLCRTTISRLPGTGESASRAYQRGEVHQVEPKESARLVARCQTVCPPSQGFPQVDYHPAIKADDIVELKKSEAFAERRCIKAPVNITSSWIPAWRGSGIK
jgi:sulfonate transport system substrate-binding protein